MFSKSDKYPEVEHVRPVVECGPGRTKQSEKESADINNIMKKYRKTGLVSFVAKRKPEYMTAPDLDFKDAMDYVTNANNMFADMPADLRKRFNNSPGEFLDFVHDPANENELVSLGLATAQEVEVLQNDLPGAPEEPEAPV